MIFAFIIAPGVVFAAALAFVAIVFGRPALDRLHRWLDWRHAARMQVRRKLEFHRSLWTRADRDHEGEPIHGARPANRSTREA